MINHSTSFGLASLLLWSSIVHAQHDSIPEPIQLNEIVISYNKIEEKKSQIAQPIELIDSKTIARSQAQTTADLISQNGSVLVQKSQQGGGSPIIRGFEASRILLVVDGVRMNNLIYRAGHLQNIMTVDNIALDRAEILFGPSSTQYGTDALGGSIHLFTKKPILSSDENPMTQVGLRSRYSTVNQESTTGLDVNLGWKRFASRTIASFSRFGDLRSGSNKNPFFDGNYIRRDSYVLSDFDKPGAYGIDSIITNEDPDLQIKSGYSQYNLLQKFLFKQNDQVSHGLNLQYSSSSNLPRYDRLTDVSGGALKWSEWYYGPQERLMLSYDLDLKREGSFFDIYRLNLNHQIIEESRYQRRYRNPNLQRRIENVTVSGFNLFAQHKSNHHEMQIGVDGQVNNLTSTASSVNIYTGSVSGLDTRYPDGDNNMNLGGVYLTHLWKVSDKTNITDGVRVGYSRLNSTIADTSIFKLPFTSINQNTPTYSGSLGLVHNPTDRLKVSALISSAFRVPNIDDLAKVFESTPGSLIVPNANIKPEKSITYEVGVSKVFGRILRWETAVYYTSFMDAIQTASFTYNGSDSVFYDGEISRVLAAQNIGQASIYGFNSNVKSMLNKYWTIYASCNYTYGRIKSEDGELPLDHISPLMAKLSVNYERERFFGEAYALYNGAKKLEDYSDSGEDNLNYATEEGMPAWYTLNARIGYTFKNYLSFQGGVENILDTEYRVFASGINAPGRNFYVSLKFNY
ncbi:MAG: TonB-dependent receptor plug domain-containing protein [Flavobacteriales bacterium]